MSVGRFCRREVWMARDGDALHEVAVHMRERNVGTLVVMDAADKVVGIVTDRDLVVRGLAGEHPVSDLKVNNVMTAQPVVVTEQTSVHAALEIMKEGAFRRLPVVNDDGDLVGVFAVDDMLGVIARDQALILDIVSSESPTPPLSM